MEKTRQLESLRMVTHLMILFEVLMDLGCNSRLESAVMRLSSRVIKMSLKASGPSGALQPPAENFSRSCLIHKMSDALDKHASNDGSWQARNIGPQVSLTRVHHFQHNQDSFLDPSQAMQYRSLALRSLLIRNNASFRGHRVQHHSPALGKLVIRATSISRMNLRLLRSLDIIPLEQIPLPLPHSTALNARLLPRPVTERTTSTLPAGRWP